MYELEQELKHKIKNKFQNKKLCFYGEDYDGKSYFIDFLPCSSASTIIRIWKNVQHDKIDNCKKDIDDIVKFLKTDGYGVFNNEIISTTIKNDEDDKSIEIINHCIPVDSVIRTIAGKNVID